MGLIYIKLTAFYNCLIEFRPFSDMLTMLGVIFTAYAV